LLHIAAPSIVVKPSWEAADNSYVWQKRDSLLFADAVASIMITKRIADKIWLKLKAKITVDEIVE
jgi:hypothetical protein